MNTLKFSFKDKILYWIILVLGFQQFPIIRAGGSLKIYEVLGFILMSYNFIAFRIKKRPNNIEISSFIFFVVIPLGSYIYSSIFFEYPTQYFVTFPKAVIDFRSNYYIFPLLQVMYMIMNWHVFVGFCNSKALYENIEKVIKVAVIFGTIISLYSLCALYVIDFVPLLPGWIQFKFTKEGNRSTGLSMEPGTYVLYQIWICLFLWYSKKSFTKGWWYILFVINVISCILTQSTALLGLVLAILFSFLIFNTTKAARGKSLFRILIIIILVYTLVQFLGYGSTFYYYFYSKVTSFFTASANHKAEDSGAIRKYMSDIGFAIFHHYSFLGVGYGRSIYYMYLFKKSVGISYSSEAVRSISVPLSMYAIISAEMGTLGLLAFSIFYFTVLKIFWKNRNKSPLHKMFLLGSITELSTLFSLYTPHAVFLWAYLGLGIGYLRYFDRKGDNARVKNVI